jgi:signal transduction histidine kinase
MRPDLSLKPTQQHRSWSPYFVLAIALLLTAGATYYVAMTAQAKDQLRFENAVGRTKYDIQNRLETYIALLRGTSGLFAASDRISRDDFHAYVNSLELQHRYPGIQGIGFSVRVMPKAKDALVAQMRRQAVENFTIRPEWKRSDYHAIVYLEPLERRNKVAIGFDMFTEPIRRTAMSRARDTGTPAASGRVTLVQEIDPHKQAGFLIYVPVYRHGLSPNTVAERQDALWGFVYSPFRAEDFFAGIFGTKQQRYVDFQIYDGKNLSPEHLLYSSHHPSTSYQPRFQTTRTIDVAGHSWTIAFTSRSEFEGVSQRNLVPYILLSGLAIGFVLFGVTRSQALARYQVQQLNASLEYQVQERTAQLQQAFDFAAMLKRIADKVRDSLDEHQILQTAVQELALGLHINRCNTGLYDINRATSTVGYEYSLTMPAAKEYVVQMASFPEGYRQLLQGQHFQFCPLLPDPVHGQSTILCCPIFDAQEVLGDLWLFNQPNYTFNELQIRLVQQVANQCAIALRQARLYKAAQAQVEVLEKLNSLKDDFLSTVSHELRTPVSNMKMAIRMLEILMKPEEMSREQRSKATHYLQILHKECQREISLIEDLLDLQRLESGKQPLVLETIQLELWLPQLVRSFQERAQAQQQTLLLDLPDEKLPPLVSEISSLERILTELLNNACKYTPAGEQIIVSVRAHPSRMQLTVSNSGTEIPASELSHIFDKFYRVTSADPWKQAGTGLGLALVHRLTEHLSGNIRVESAAGQTAFTVELPNQALLTQAGNRF